MFDLIDLLIYQKLSNSRPKSLNELYGNEEFMLSWNRQCTEDKYFVAAELFD